MEQTAGPSNVGSPVAAPTQPAPSQPANYGKKLTLLLQTMSGDACYHSRTRWHTRKLFCLCDLSHAQNCVQFFFFFCCCSKYNFAL